MDKFKPVLTHLVAFILGLGIMYLSGRTPDPQETKQEAKEIAREAAAVALSAARESATAALATATAPIPEVATVALDIAEEHLDKVLDKGIEAAVEKGAELLPGDYYQQFVGDWTYKGGPTAKYARGRLSVEAGRKNKAGIVDTPYNLTFSLATDEGSVTKVFTGGFGFYATGKAFGKTRAPGATQDTVHRDTQVSMHKVGDALILDIPAIGLSEHFQR